MVTSGLLQFYILDGPRLEKTCLHGFLSACSSRQTDQRLCYSPIGKCHIETVTREFQFSSRSLWLKDWLESRFVGNPEERFSRDVAQMIADSCTLLCHTYQL